MMCSSLVSAVTSSAAISQFVCACACANFFISAMHMVVVAIVVCSPLTPFPSAGRSLRRPAPGGVADQGGPHEQGVAETLLRAAPGQAVLQRDEPQGW